VWCETALDHSATHEWVSSIARSLQQRLEPIHVLADMRIEVAKPDVARRYSLSLNLFP
jgi:hypothetical protein